MSDEDLISAMRRKAGVGRPPPDVTAMSAAKALRLAVAKAAEDVTGMVMQVTDVQESLTTISVLPSAIPDHSLLALLEGPEHAYGLAIFSLAVTTSVVEQMTTGNVQKYAPEERSPTSTDSVMCFELIDSMLKYFEKIVVEAVEPPLVDGYCTAAQLSEPRSIPIAFDDIRYKMFRITVDMGRGLRQGEIMFIYPAMRPKPKLEPGVQSDWETSFQASVLKTEASLETVLHRVSLSLSDVVGLEIGMTLPIPREAFTRVEVVADGRRMSYGRLGQMNGHRAIRIDFDPPEISDDEGGISMGLGTDAMAGFDVGADVPALDIAGGMDDFSGELPSLGDLPAMGGGEADMSGGLPSLGGLGSDFPAMGDMGDMSDIGDMNAMGDMGGDLPSLSDLGDLDGMSDFPAMGDIPPLE
ncbi:FliM/FliN family flagellar motor switch protein [Pacificibacter marinus]|uniref:Flagellar motor switch protein FliM n=1 Tax=Pacificibacter marinus TaxID=658057 RepID=A0A1Y5T002_9RHOB|nr:FliM/FliN family flagellar motor switch protein [Pacificibacter marinus]SEK86732.1 flagellar motor switch protein FliM [Pacificibacter marinus]SLN50471.1 flagellar motor switch protein FliM [Pacificibacter marinus]